MPHKHLPLDARFSVFYQSRDGSRKGRYEIMSREQAEDEIEICRAADNSRVYWIAPSNSSALRLPPGVTLEDGATTVDKPAALTALPDRTDMW